MAGAKAVAGAKVHTATLQDTLMVSYKIKHILSVQSSNCTPWYLPEEAENMSTQSLARRQFIAAFFTLFTIPQTWKQPRYPSLKNG